MLTPVSNVLNYCFGGEVADLLTHLQVTIMRPAVMIGTEDRILNPWAHFAKKYGFIPLFGDGSTKYVFVTIYCHSGRIYVASMAHALRNAFAEFNLYSLLMLLLQLLLL